MSDTKMNITLGQREFILIGTAHVSRESIDEVRRTIQEEKPNHVCVELDAGRYATMTGKDSWEKLDMAKVFKDRKGFLLMANLVLSGFQRRMGAELGVKPGEEMKIALETAEEMGIPHSLCDREVQITLRRAWARCGFWSKAKLLASLLTGAFETEKMKPEEIEKLKSHNELDSMMSELADYLPKVKETLIDERDQYLAAKIWETPAGADRILAVVGAGHMQGIKTHLEKLASAEESSDVSGFDQIPPKSIISKALGFIFPLALLTLLVIGFFRAGAQMSFTMLVYWILWNGTLAALGAILALGHPLAILVSFFGAPITSLSPFIGVGILSGLVQVYFRKPRVSDVQSIMDDISSIKGFYRNRISKALLVFLFSSLGSSIGTFISIPAIAALLAK